MNITCQKIEDELCSGFASKYRRFSNFIDSGYLWDLVIITIHNAKLMEHIIFCNDVLKMPPVKVFVLAQQPALQNLTTDEKQSIGAVFGFIYKEIFGYTNQESVSCVVNTIKTATRFYFSESDKTETITIRGDE